jgi:hypothetical protein
VGGWGGRAGTGIQQMLNKYQLNTIINGCVNKCMRRLKYSCYEILNMLNDMKIYLSYC